jgi:hypothetical protein
MASETLRDKVTGLESKARYYREMVNRLWDVAVHMEETKRVLRDSEIRIARLSSSGEPRAAMPAAGATKEE